MQVGVLWNISTDSGRRWWPGSRNRAAEAPQEVTTVNLSVSGAAILAPTSKSLEIGNPVVIELAGCRGTVVVCRTQETADPDKTIYGVAFVDMSPEFRECVWRLLGVVVPSELVAQ